MSIKARSPNLALAGRAQGRLGRPAVVRNLDHARTTATYTRTTGRTWLLAVFGPVFGRPGGRAEAARASGGAAGDERGRPSGTRYAAEGMPPDQVKPARTRAIESLR